MSEKRECYLCKKSIEPGTPTVETVGGFFDPDDPEFFVIDEGVLHATRMHRDCFAKKIIEAKGIE